MRKIILILSSIIVSLAILALLALLALRYWFNPNTLIMPLSNQIQQRTGLLLRIDGKLTWHVFPKTNITVEQLSLQPAVANTNAPHAEIQSLDIHLALWPLLTEKKVIIDTVTLDGLDLTIPPKTTQTLKQISSAPLTTTSTNALSSNHTGKKAITFDIKNITLTHAALRGLLDTSHPGAIIYVDNLTLKNLNSGLTSKTIPIDMAARIENNGHNIALSLQSNITFDLLNQAVRIDDLQAHINSLQLQGNISATHITTSPQWQGKLTTDDDDATNTLQLLTGQDIAVIKTLHSEFTVNANHKTIDIAPLALKLNGEAISGSLHYDIQQHHMTSNLNADTLHWPDFSAMKTPVIATTMNNNSAAAPAIAQKTSSPSASDTVSRFSLDSQIHVQHLLYNNLSLDNIKGQLHYSKNTVTLDPLAVTVLQGLYQGELIWTKTHSIQIAGTLSHLNLALLQQALGKKTSVTGLLDAKGSLSTEGQNQPQRLSHLNGQVFAVITQGSWTHLNVTNILSFLNAASNRQIVSDGNEFSSASGTFNIHNGITNNPDLKFTSALLTAKGSGSLDLIAHTLNYKIMLHPNAALLQQINALSQWIEQDIPLTVKGSWTNPKIKVQHGALLKKKVEEQLGDTLNTVRHLIIIR